MIDLRQLMVCTGAGQQRATAALDGLNAALIEYDITTPARAGMLLANIGHETKGLLYLKELGGHTYLMRYEGREDLGNVKPGDGLRFCGRGYLQTTGRANYVKLRDRLRAQGVDCPDFEGFPELLEQPKWAALSACDYVAMRRLNQKADAGDFLGYCIGINGRNKRTGLPNGWSERTDLWAAAQRVLA
jgi:putative chitinase